MEKYRRVAPAKDADAPPPDEAVIRVQVQGKIANYVAYAAARLEDPDKARIEVVGLGRAINTAVTVAEVLRRKVPDLHQLTSLSSVSLKDHWEPLEEGLDPVETERTVSCIAIQLVKGGPGSLDTTAPGYSPPLTEDESALVTPANLGAMDAVDRDRGRAPRGGGSRRGGGSGARGRGGRGGGHHRRGARSHAASAATAAKNSGNSKNGEAVENGAVSHASARAGKHASAAHPASVSASTRGDAE